jgi:hypothetical protein
MIEAAVFLILFTVALLAGVVELALAKLAAYQLWTARLARASRHFAWLAAQEIARHAWLAWNDARIEHREYDRGAMEAIER